MLQTAAIALVGERGLAAVTADDIATAAGVSRRTFFNHFPTKAAALFDPDPSDAERLARLLADADGAAGPWQALATACVDFVSGHEDVIAVRRRLVAESPELDQYHRTAHRHAEIALSEWAHGQPGMDDFLATLLAQTAAAVMITAFYSWQPDDPPDLLPQLVRQGFDRVTGGL
jgi:AcrR family transcriptional regulator